MESRGPLCPLLTGLWAEEKQQSPRRCQLEKVDPEVRSACCDRRQEQGPESWPTGHRGRQAGVREGSWWKVRKARPRCWEQEHNDSDSDPLTRAWAHGHSLPQVPSLCHLPLSHLTWQGASSLSPKQRIAPGMFRLNRWVLPSDTARPPRAGTMS